MFSFFSKSKQDQLQKVLSINEAIDELENNKSLSDSERIRLIGTFGREKNNKHGNNYVLQALAWNKLYAAKILLELDKDKIALNMQDEWPTCLNTPLILAAKINAADVVAKLITLGADLDRQDYRGYTALHYACLLRNDAMITMLLDAGASTHLRDAFGKLPLDYYRMTINKEDLLYRYGKEDGFLKHVPDMDNHYFSSRKKCLSALRWYIAHIIVNNQLGKDIKVNHRFIYDLACKHLTIREPVYHAAEYDTMMQCFCDHRPLLDLNLMQKLRPDPVFCNAYNDEKYDQYRLFTSDLVPQLAVHLEDKEVWVELQKMHSTASLTMNMP